MDFPTLHGRFLGMALLLIAHPFSSSPAPAQDLPSSPQKLFALEATQVQKMSGKEFRWHLVEEFPDGGQTLESDWLLQQRSPEEYFVTKSGPYAVDFYATTNKRRAVATHSARRFITDGYGCQFRTTTIQFPMLRLYGWEEENKEYYRDKHEWALEHVGADRLNLTLRRKEFLALRAHFVFPSAMCVKLEEYRGTGVWRTLEVLPGGAVEGFPFLPKNCQSTSTVTDGTRRKSTSNFLSVAPINNQTYPVFRAPRGYETMTLEESRKRNAGEFKQQQQGAAKKTP
jgi:hypothetical protein